MREQHKNILIVLFPTILMLLALFCYVLQNLNFPVLGNMITKAQKEQIKLQKQIVFLEQIIMEKNPQLEQLNLLQEHSLPVSDDVSGQFRSRVEQAFYTSGANVRTVGSPRKVKETDKIELYEINITATLKANELLAVIKKLSEKPALLWRVVTFRPNNMLNPEFINVNLTIGGIIFKGEETKNEDST
ncbi:hypothetical protein AAEX28_15230 [Lentisphaerota bacterium WC36G]|nr:hypothetical protein LJT99_02000 [Lentisphaerae bacterium WC36]